MNQAAAARSKKIFQLILSLWMSSAREITGPLIAYARATGMRFLGMERFSQVSCASFQSSILRRRFLSLAAYCQ